MKLNTHLYAKILIPGLAAALWIGTLGSSPALAAHVPVRTPLPTRAFIDALGPVLQAAAPGMRHAIGIFLNAPSYDLSLLENHLQPEYMISAYYSEEAAANPEFLVYPFLGRFEAPSEEEESEIEERLLRLNLFLAAHIKPDHLEALVLARMETVSYTHLTLPTIYSV